MTGRSVVLVEIVRGQPPTRYDAEELRRAVASGLVAPMVFASTDDGATWVRAHEAVGLAAPAEAAPAAGGDAVLRMILPVGRSIWAILAGYWGLVSLFAALFWIAPIAETSRAKPDPAGLLQVAGGMLIALVLPTAGFAALGHRAIKKNAGKHGMGRVVFAYVTAGLHLALMLLAIVLSFSR